MCQTSHKAQSVGNQEDVSAASQLPAAVPLLPLLSTASSGLAHSGESSPQRRPVRERARPVAPPSDQTLPPSGKHRLICSVEVPGIGQAAKVRLTSL